MRETIRQVILPLWNSWYFLTLYANAEQTSGTFNTSSTNVLDRYVLAKTRELVESITADMDTYDLYLACSDVRTFLDALTNWYIRRSRDRFWAGDQDAFDTLHTVLSVVCTVVAPLLPLTSEAIYRGLTGARSVHLEDWPDASSLPSDRALVDVMDRVRDVCSATLSVRKLHARRVRQPLATLTIADPSSGDFAAFVDLIADEVNVKNVVLVVDVASVATSELQVVPAALGPRLGGQTQQVIKAVKAGDWRRDGDTIVAGGFVLEQGEFSLRLVATQGGASAVLAGGSGVVVLDCELTPELEAEGVARDLVRLVQQARRDAGLDVSDRIELTVFTSERIRQQLLAHISFVCTETLSTVLNWGSDEPVAEMDSELDGEPVLVRVSRA
jgi:isoleucyl-tRNA synthetase